MPRTYASPWMARPEAGDPDPRPAHEPTAKALLIRPLDARLPYLPEADALLADALVADALVPDPPGALPGLPPALDYAVVNPGSPTEHIVATPAEDPAAYFAQDSLHRVVAAEASDRPTAHGTHDFGYAAEPDTGLPALVQNAMVSPHAWYPTDQPVIPAGDPLAHVYGSWSSGTLDGERVHAVPMDTPLPVAPTALPPEVVEAAAAPAHWFAQPATAPLQAVERFYTPAPAHAAAPSHHPQPAHMTTRAGYEHLAPAASSDPARHSELAFAPGHHHTAASLAPTSPALARSDTGIGWLMARWRQTLVLLGIPGVAGIAIGALMLRFDLVPSFLL